MNNKKILIIILIVLALCILCSCLGVGGYFIFLKGKPSDPFASNNNNNNQAEVTQVVETTPVSTASQDVPAEDPAVSADQQKWLVMLYQDADDEILEADIFFDANEAEYSGSSERVTVVTQVDRIEGAFEGGGNWSTAKRYVLNADTDLHTMTSQEITDLGEVNMGEPATLVDFVTWAIRDYPADRYVLILSDHGGGWMGGLSDGDNQDDGMNMREIDQALGEIITRSGIGNFDVLVFDACLMAQLEALTMLEPHADIAVASEEIIPSIGLAYNGFLSQLIDDPGMSAEDLARWMVNSYINEDLRIIDSDARLEFLSEAFNYTGEATADELIVEMNRGTTLAAINLKAVPALNLAMNNLAYELTFVDQAAVARARTYAQSYYNIYGPDVPPSFLDLGNFASLLVNETGSSDVSTAANRLYAALDDVIIIERHAAEVPGSTGISIYFPNSELYTSEIAGYAAYNDGVDRFVEDSQWDDFLAFHYTGTTFEPDFSGAVIPAPGTQLQPPGSGNIDMGTLTASPETISQGGTVHLQTQITGDNIGYVYLFAGKFFPESNTYLATDADFITSASAKEVNGVNYPDWGAGPIDISIDWTPTNYYISDGVKSEFAVLYPLEYGATRDQNVYAVDGTFTFGDSGVQTYAVMTFGPDGWMIKVMSFQPEGGGSREITPRAGDTFTLLLKAIALDPDDPNTEPEFVEFEGGTLTFGTSNFYWDAVPAEPGKYVAGFGALDLDGNYNLNFIPIVIE